MAQITLSVPHPLGGGGVGELEADRGRLLAAAGERAEVPQRHRRGSVGQAPLVGHGPELHRVAVEVVGGKALGDSGHPRSHVTDVAHPQRLDAGPDPGLASTDHQHRLQGPDQGGVGGPPGADRTQMLGVGGVEHGHEAGQPALHPDLEDGVGLEDPRLGSGVPVVVDLDGDHAPVQLRLVIDGQAVDGRTRPVVDRGRGGFGGGGGFDRGGSRGGGGGREGGVGIASPAAGGSDEGERDQESDSHPEDARWGWR